MASEAAAAVASRGSSASRPPLLSLPHELQLLCLRWLDVSSLCLLCAVSRCLQAASEDWQLWSALYVCRWPVRREAQAAEAAGRWKAEYRERERSEEDEADAAFAPCGASATESDWRSLRAAMRRRRRGSRRAVNEFELIAEYRRRHSRQRSAQHPSAAASPESAGCCCFVSCVLDELLPGLVLCRASLRAHWCSDSECCDNESRRCPVTGRFASHSLLLSMSGDGEAEEGEAEAGGLGDGEAEDNEGWPREAELSEEEEAEH